MVLTRFHFDPLIAGPNPDAVELRSRTAAAARPPDRPPVPLPPGSELSWVQDLEDVCTPEWSEYIERLARHMGWPCVVLLRRAITNFAESTGFFAWPPEDLEDELQ